MPSIVPDSQSGELASVKVGSPAFNLFEQPKTKNADIVDLGIEYTSDDSRSQGTITPIQQSHRQSPLEDHSRNVPSRLNTELREGGNSNPELQDPNNSRTPERHLHSSDTVTISGTKRAAADLDCKSFLHIE